MRVFLTFFLIMSIFGLSAQNIQLLDSVTFNQLNLDDYEYINVSVKQKLVIEQKSDIIVDFSLIDVKKDIDSIILKFSRENNEVVFCVDEMKPLLIQNVDSTVLVQLKAYQKGKQVTFTGKQKDELAFKIERRERPVFVQDTIVFGLLAVILALIFYTSQLKSWKKFYTFVPALLLCYIVPALLDSMGLISKEYSSLYTMAKNYLLPGALILMTIGIDFRAIINLGPKALIMFLTATLGIIVGGPIAVWVYSFIDPEVVGGIGDQAAWRGLATLAGSWIGGGANQAAMLETYGYNQEFYGKMVTVDIVVANLWMAFLLWGAARAEKFDKWLKADTSSIEELKKKTALFQKETAKIPTLVDYMVILGITFGIVGFSHFAGKWLATILGGSLGQESPFSSSFFWLVVLATTGGLIVSATKLRKYEGVGASKIGSIFIYILVATIGMKMELEKAIEEPQLILVGIIWMLVHVLILFIVAKLIKAPFFFVAVGSKANIGGAASAPIVAAAFHPSLASVGAILAVLGYALGTYGAILCAEMMRMVAPM